MTLKITCKQLQYYLYSAMSVQKLHTYLSIFKISSTKMLENIEREYLNKKTMDVSAILFTFQSISLEANEPNVRSARTLRFL